MSLDRFGALIGFAVTIIGAGLVALFPTAREIGITLVAIGVVVLAVTLFFAIYSNWQTIRAEAKRLGASQIILLIGLAGTWLFMTIGLGTAAWMVWTQQGFAIGVSGIGAGVKEDDGPMQWFRNLTMEGGLLQTRNVFSLKFRDVNISQKEVELKSASIIFGCQRNQVAARNYCSG
jgi:hypothetical protein